MKSLWDKDAAAAAVVRYGTMGVGEDLALRTYSARLLGADPSLVLHGGGNTSVKTTARDVFGDAVEVLCVKGSGWDLATIEPAGHPAVRLAPLRRLRALARLSDEEMVNAQRQNLMDTAAPNPSVETLLHAFLAPKFIDHTHAEAILALANQPDGPAIVAGALGERVGIVPYVMPGFDLAKLAATVHEARPGVHGLVLLNHGIFSFGEDVRESYERMIALVGAARAFIDRKPAIRGRTAGRAPSPARIGEALASLRGALARAAGDTWPGRWILDMRDGGAAAMLAGHSRLAEWAALGVATPDHVIRTKRRPLVLPAPSGGLYAWREAADGALTAFAADYRRYFAEGAARAEQPKQPLDPLPRVVAIAGVGLVGIGRSAAEAAVAADIAQSWARTVIDAERVGAFCPLGEGDTFDMEYWSLEQAKIGKAAERRLARRIAVVTGGGGAIGAETARAFAAEGAEVAILDIDGGAAGRVARAIGPLALAIACDVTDPDQVEAAFAAVCRRFGGVDIVVSNAGSARRGMIAEVSGEALRKSFDVNFFAHQSVAQAAVRVMRLQAMGGTLLFNVSKQAVNPGPDFGAYGAAKAALLALVRQYALEHGSEGIRANAINPDRIRSGLLTDEMIAARAKARGVSEADYLAGNLLRREVRARDVADAFVFAALMESTTGAVIPVDGGNVAAMLR
jgi:rhamnose utilization protein RhaD (predicted bifunctional aldolase and dehydrogenase)/NAD(P)-dependent dehydrogenase (short-subunit alcohol dehydrogenase family)